MSETLVSEDLSWASASQLAQALARREIGALEATDAAIARIEARDGPINAVVVRDFDRARTAAKAVDAALSRGERGPLLGVPMTVKESHNVAGLPTTWGFEHAKGWIAPADSLGVARLKAAGAVILGKTNVPVSLSDWQTVNPIYGRTRNPWNLERTPGGSSGGAAAALAAGMIHLEFGSDIGGSIRAPAHFCGLYGHKPSYGLIPAEGHVPPGLTGVDVPLGVVGPLARTAEDLALAMDVLAGPDDLEAAGYRLDLAAARHDRISGYRVLVLDQHPAGATSSDVRAAIGRLADDLVRLGANVSHASDLLPDLVQAHSQYLSMLTMVMSRGAPPRPEPPLAHDFMNLQDAQLALRLAWRELFKAFDIVLAPVHGTPAFAHDDAPSGERVLMVDGQPQPYFGQLAWPGVATYANLPATAIPAGRSAEGLPIGAQLIGPYLEDRTPLKLAALLERELGGFVPPPGY